MECYIALGRKGLQGTNALTYWAHLKVTKKNGTDCCENGPSLNPVGSYFIAKQQNSSHLSFKTKTRSKTGGVFLNLSTDYIIIYYC
jgi:hypothetical protein